MLESTSADENTSSPMSVGSGGGGARQDGVPGILKTKISLGKNPSVIMPFYLMNMNLPGSSDITGDNDLLEYYGLRSIYTKFCTRKLREELGAFLPQIPGDIDSPAAKDNSSLMELIEKPPIIGKEILPLSSTALSSFRLHPGQIPEEYRALAGISHKKKDKKEKRRKRNSDGLDTDYSSRADEDISKEKRKKKKDKKKKKGSPEHSGVSTPMETDSLFDM